jgi:hypothetical protein
MMPDIAVPDRVLGNLNSLETKIEGGNQLGEKVVPVVELERKI